jgi:protein TonB
MRVVAAVVAGIAISLLLFLLMHALVGGRDGFEGSAERGRVVDFVRVKPEQIVQTRERRVPRKPPPPDKPPPPRLQAAGPQPKVKQPLDIEMPDIAVTLNGGPAVATGWEPSDIGSDGDVVPIVRVEPSYPRDAIMRGLEGWVQVRFTINPDGSVADPEVVAAEPPRIFNREAVRAILRWKFRPRIVDGQPVAREAEQLIEFRIGEETR